MDQIHDALSRRRAGVKAIALLTLAIFPAMHGLAQTPAPSTTAPPTASQEDIIVQAKREEAIRAFVAGMTDPDPGRQIGRWDTVICPSVTGIASAQAAFMEARIADVAASLDLRTLEPGCRPTMLVIVDNDVATFTETLAKRLPITLRTDGVARLRQFVASMRPVRWLSITDPCGFGGCTLPGSRLSSAERPAFRAMIVIVDGKQIGSVSLAELSDYVAFVALGNPPLEGKRAPTSILSMFDRERPQGAHFELTGGDRTFLEGVYRSRVNGLGQEQRASIVHHMKEQAASPVP